MEVQEQTEILVSVSYTHLFAPVHLLFINLLTDSLPAIALGLEPHSKNVMKEKPRPINESILTKDFLINIGLEGLSICTMVMIAFTIGYKDGNALLASTMAFATLCCSRLFHGFNCKSNRPVVFTKRVFNNIYLIGAFVIGMILITLVVTVPGLHNICLLYTSTCRKSCESNRRSCWRRRLGSFHLPEPCSDDHRRLRQQDLRLLSQDFLHVLPASLLRLLL